MTGRMSLNKGKKAERDVANYLTNNGIPARRHVITGDRDHHDAGDIKFDGVTIEVKNWSGDLTIGSVVTLLAKLEVQRGTDPIGLLVDRLDRVADPGQWACWMIAETAAGVLTGSAAYMPDGPVPAGSIWPVRMQFGHVVRLLIWGSWVSQVVNPFDDL